jgi:hypothetical protein
VIRRCFCTLVASQEESYWKFSTAKEIELHVFVTSNRTGIVQMIDRLVDARHSSMIFILGVERLHKQEPTPNFVPSLLLMSGVVNPRMLSAS